MNVCVCRVGEEQTVLSLVLREALVITAFRPATVGTMHLVEAVTGSVSASRDGWALDARKVSILHEFVLKIMVSVLYYLYCISIVCIVII